MSPQREGRRTGWKPPRDRREVVVAVLVALGVVVVTVALVWFLRPNQDSGSSTSDTTPATSAVSDTTTTVAPSTTVAPTTVPAASSPT